MSPKAPKPKPEKSAKLVLPKSIAVSVGFSIDKRSLATDQETVPKTEVFGALTTSLEWIDSSLPLLIRQDELAVVYRSLDADLPGPILPPPVDSPNG